MQTVRKMRKRSGFTLVELLIVIIIIGILAGAMLLVAGSGTDTAEATKVVSDLRSLKSAALLYYADNIGKTPPDINDLKKYMDRTVDTGFSVTTLSADWFIKKDLSGAASGVKTKLEGMAASSALLKAMKSGELVSADYYGGSDEVFMRAR